MSATPHRSRDSLVGIATCDTYAREAIAESLHACLAHLGGMEEFVKPGDRVLVKPNLLKRAIPDAAVTTHPELVRAVVNAARAAGAAEVLVGDSPGGPPNPRLFRTLTEAAGIAQLCAEEEVRLVQFEQTARASVPADGPGYVRYSHFELGREAVETDVLISLPKLKTHGFMHMTGAVKNLFGLIPGLAKAGYHMTVPERDEFADMLVDLALARHPELTIMDAVVGMEGQGPGGGDPVRIGALLASADPFAMDVIASALCGFAPTEVYTNVAAHNRGLCPRTPDEVRTAGADWRALVPLHFEKPPRDLSTLVPRWASSAMRATLFSRPRLAKAEECTACGICAQSCPVDAIEIAPGGARGDAAGPVFDYDACIRCYCCHEMCPPQAIKLRTPWLLRAITRRERGER